MPISGLSLCIRNFKPHTRLSLGGGGRLGVEVGQHKKTGLWQAITLVWKVIDGWLISREKHFLKQNANKIKRNNIGVSTKYKNHMESNTSKDRNKDI